MATAIFYGTNTGNCKEIAKTISTQLGKIETFNFDKTKVEKINVHISEYSDSNAGVVPDTFAMRFSRL